MGPRHQDAPGNRMCLEAIWGYNIQTRSCVGYDHNWVRGYSYADDMAAPTNSPGRDEGTRGAEPGARTSCPAARCAASSRSSRTHPVRPRSRIRVSSSKTARFAVADDADDADDARLL